MIFIYWIDENVSLKKIDYSRFYNFKLTACLKKRKENHKMLKEILEYSLFDGKYSYRID